MDFFYIRLIESVGGSSVAVGALPEPWFLPNYHVPTQHRLTCLYPSSYATQRSTKPLPLWGTSSGRGEKRPSEASGLAGWRQAPQDALDFTQTQQSTHTTAQCTHRLHTTVYECTQLNTHNCTISAQLVNLYSFDVHSSLYPYS